MTAELTAAAAQFKQSLDENAAQMLQEIWHQGRPHQEPDRNFGWRDNAWERREIMRENLQRPRDRIQQDRDSRGQNFQRNYPCRYIDSLRGRC